jgi:hypothetical protein
MNKYDGLAVIGCVASNAGAAGGNGRSGKRNAHAHALFVAWRPPAACLPIQSSTSPAVKRKG